jgi:hypothetical protein
VGGIRPDRQDHAAVTNWLKQAVATLSARVAIANSVDDATICADHDAILVVGVRSQLCLAD